MGDPKKHVFCADDMPFLTGTPRRVKWQPSCRMNSPDPGNSFLGAVLNSDPVGNTRYILNQVNPLTSNPLNGLEMVGNTLTSFTSSVNTMSKTMGDIMHRRRQDVSPFTF